MREPKVRLDRWCEGGLRQQRNDGGGPEAARQCAKDQEKVERPGTYVRISRGHFCLALCLSNRPPVLWLLKHGQVWKKYSYLHD